MNECNLGKGRFPKQCCCICRSQHRLAGVDRNHVGYVCSMMAELENGPMLITGPFKHSIGCEMFMKGLEQPSYGNSYEDGMVDHERDQT
jgi:hypothetical protein